MTTAALHEPLRRELACQFLIHSQHLTVVVEASLNPSSVILSVAKELQ